jgi:hypothetical protein
VLDEPGLDAVARGHTLLPGSNAHAD